VSAPSCVGEPISWLRIEQLRLGELSADDRRAVEAHLAACPACAACLGEVDRPFPLPPLRAPAAPPGRWAWPRWPLLAASAGGALALALVLVGRGESPGPSRIASKGGGVALQLVNDRTGVLDNDVTTFTPGDRWKALVTCPAGRLVFWDLVVIDGFDGDGRIFPLAPSAPIACGNHVPLEGAFRLAGTGPIAVCAMVAENPIDRRRLPPLDPAAPPEGTACVGLRPAPPRGP
jgi:hypothetical protein